MALVHTGVLREELLSILLLREMILNSLRTWFLTGVKDMVPHWHREMVPIWKTTDTVDVVWVL